MTLVELMISFFVLGLMMTMVVSGVVSALRGEATASAQMETLRQSTTALDRLERELRMCQQVYIPDVTSSSSAKKWPRSGPYTPKLTKRPFTFKHPTWPLDGAGPCGYQVVAYRWDCNRQVLQRVLYCANSYSPCGNPPTCHGMTWQCVAINVTNFAVQPVSMNGNAPCNAWYMGVGLTVQAGSSAVTYGMGTPPGPCSTPLPLTIPIEGLAPGWPRCTTCCSTCGVNF
jgi:type II secretory pathway pseudopilin PulG